MNETGIVTRWNRLVIAAALSASVGIVATTVDVAEATNSLVPKTSFEIDGDTAGPDDWDAPYPVGVTPGGFPTTGLYSVNANVDNRGNPCGVRTDDQGLGGSKAQDGPIWPLDPTPTSPPNGKSDLETVYLAAEKVDVDGQIADILYVGYLSCVGGNGTFSALLFVDDGDGVFPSAGDNGDFLFRFDFNPSTGSADFLLYRRVGGSWAKQSVPSGSIDGKSGGAGDFGEAAINLTALEILDPDVCRTISVGGQTASITGGSLQSQPKDIVAVEPLVISNCGGLDVTKASNVPSDDTFHYDVDQADGRTVHDATLDVTLVTDTTEPDGVLTELDADIGVGDTDRWRRVISQPDYELVESAVPDGWVLDTIVCTFFDIFAVPPASSTKSVVIFENGAYVPGARFLVPPATFDNQPVAPTSCTITNVTSGVVVAKAGAGDPTQRFDFTVVDDSDSVVVDMPSIAIGESSELSRITPGHTVTVTEAVPPGTPTWTLDSIACAGDVSGAIAASGPPATSITFDTRAGEVITCTFTNVQDTQLTLVKEVVNDNGGTAVSSDWTLAADGPTPISGAGGADGVVAPGTYTLSETGVAGYAASAWSCTDGTLGGDQLTLVAGDDATCTIVNDDEAPSLTLVKQVVNDDGGSAEAADWTLSADGPTPISGAGGAVSGAGFVAGTYTLSESVGPVGYTPSTWSCTGGVQDGAEITLELGESATCTIVNDDDAPSLTLVKEVVNDDGGTAVAADWTLTAVGYDPAGPVAGTYELIESGPDGYTLVSLTCDNAAGGVASVTIGPGEDVTCTFVNDDDAPSLTLVKQVVNDDGGTAVAADWTLTADGPTPISGPGGATSGAGFSAGTYALSEVGPGGYSASGWVCVGGTQDGASIALGLGESATCTIVNDDHGPGLTLTKIVVNDNGGTAVAEDFALTADGPTPISGLGTATSGPGFEAGTYVLSEAGPAGYTAGGWDCTGGIQDGASITLGLDESATCTIVNDDDAPRLTLVKQVVNDDGGPAVAADWTLTAQGPTPISGPGGATSGATFEAGIYELTEEGPDGYVLSSLTCDNGEGDVTSVSLALGDDVTCRYVNDDEPVDLELTKDDGGASAIAGGEPFTYTITVANVGDRALDLGEPVTVTDELPAGLVWVTFPASCSQAGQVLTCNVDPAALNAGPVAIAASVEAPAVSPSGTYVNRAWVTTQDDPVCEPAGECVPPPCPALDDNNVDCEETPVDRQGAVQILKTDNVPDGLAVEPGDSYGYELLVTNIGVSTILPGLVVDDGLPVELELVSVTGGSGWTCDNVDPIECTYAPALLPGATAPAITVFVTVAEDASGELIENVAVVTGALDRDCPELNGASTEAFEPACDQVTDEDAEVTPLNSVADLAIEKSASVSQVGAGGGFDWVLEITNLGPGTAVDVVVGDLVPTAVTVTGVSSPDFACDRSGNSVSCTVASLAAGGSGTVTIAVTVPASAAGGTVTDIGTVESDTPDPDLTNNSDDATVTIVAQAAPTTPAPAPTIPRTGTDATRTLSQAAFAFVLLGGAIVLVTRRRSEDELSAG